MILIKPSAELIGEKGRVGLDGRARQFGHTKRVARILDHGAGQNPGPFVNQALIGTKQKNAGDFRAGPAEKIIDA